MTIHLVFLDYDIMFNDADDGRCFAGTGHWLLRAFATKCMADQFVEKWAPVVAKASGEGIVYPRQSGNDALYNGVGIDLHDVADGEGFTLTIATIDVEGAT